MVILLNAHSFLPVLYERPFFGVILEQRIKVKQIIILRWIISYQLTAIYECFHLLLVKLFVKLYIKWFLLIGTRCHDGRSAVIDNNISTFVSSV